MHFSTRKLHKFESFAAGRVINMETQNMQFETWNGSVDPEVCIWRESGKMNTYFLNIIRIFFEAGTGAVTSIGVSNILSSKCKIIPKGNA